MRFIKIPYIIVFMKQIALILILLISVGIGGFFLLNNRSTPAQNQPPPAAPTRQTPTATSQRESVLCEPEQLSGTISLEPAAGNIYGSLVLTNTGTVPCNVTLGSSITAIYQAKNITLKYNSAPTPHEVTLEPNEKAYSQVHYPNGPQCPGPTAEQPVRFLYEVDGQTVPFIVAGTKKETAVVQACTDTTTTTIDIWPLSLEPIVQ